MNSEVNINGTGSIEDSSSPFLLALFINIILEQNEKTLWLAIFLGTPDEVKAYLQNKELYHKSTT